jgi:Zn-dependent peptidase ImmA (M78 family)
MDYPVKFRSDTEIMRLAERLLQHCGTHNRDRVDVIACVRQDTIWTARGKKRLVYDIRPDSEMGGDDATTAYAKGVITIAVKESVHRAAMMGEGRARLTLAHELGHAVMHDDAPKARATGVTGHTRPGWLKASKSAERQATIFAVAFLINDAVAESLPNAEEISVQFGVSLQCARIYFNELEERRNRAASAERVARKAADFCAQAVPDPVRPRYLNETCTTCGKQTLYPVGTRCKCQTCGGVVERFQDGDSCDP